jgi:predicted ATPase
MAEALGHGGRIAEGLAVIEELIGRSDRGEEHWAMSELLRIKGELLLLEGSEAAAEIEDLLRGALDLARRQDALSWELRAATSLSRLLCTQGRSADAVAVLRPVYERFTEGFATADLKAARAILNAAAEVVTP